MTEAVSKQLLPVFDKPLIYYPLTTLMLAGIRDVLVISTPQHLPAFQRLLLDGRRWGLRIEYAAQPEPKGIAQALIIAEAFLEGAAPVLILGDNLFYGGNLAAALAAATARVDGATIFAHRVKNTGLYFYDDRAVDIARTLKPSARGELEITDVNRAYLDRGSLGVELLGRGAAWLDTGTPEALLQAAQFVQTIEERQGVKVACPEEIAFRRGWVDAAQLEKLAEPLARTAYGRYLLDLLREPA
jgi:glucose-1-phosphate thymidylyltransferase